MRFGIKPGLPNRHTKTVPGYTHFWYMSSQQGPETPRSSATFLGMPKKVPPTSPFGQRLMRLRLERGLTQTQLAEMIESSQRAISRYETIAELPPAASSSASPKSSKSPPTSPWVFAPPSRLSSSSPRTTPKPAGSGRNFSRSSSCRRRTDERSFASSTLSSPPKSRSERALNSAATASHSSLLTTSARNASRPLSGSRSHLLTSSRALAG